jgi:spermidine synthase
MPKNWLASPGFGPVLIALMLSAASGLIYEIVATEMLFVYFIRSTYSVATVLSVFLSGLGLGSYLVHRYSPKISNPALLFAALQLGIAAYGFGVFLNLLKLIPSMQTTGVFLSSIAVLILPATFLGAVFPLAGNMLKTCKEQSIGLVYSVDLVGAVAGALISGFVLIPLLGNRAAILTGIGLNLFAALAISKKKAWILLLIFASTIFFFSPQPKNFSSPSPFGEVEIINSTLYIENRAQCSPKSSYTHTLLASQAILPLNNTRAEVLIIGLGCGHTVQEALRLVNTRVDVVEINPVVVKANHYLTDVVSNPRVELTIDDGLFLLRNSAKKYDAIIMDIESPIIVYSSNLFTVEGFTEVRSALKQGGIFATFLPGCSSPEYYTILYNTLKQVFENVQVDVENAYANRLHAFFCSDALLPYKEYAPRGISQELNTIDKKAISKLIPVCGSGEYDGSRFLIAEE